MTRPFTSCCSSTAGGRLSCVLIVGVAAPIVLRFAWKPILIAFVLIGVTSPAAIMLGAIAGLTILGAASLHARFSGRPF